MKTDTIFRRELRSRTVASILAFAALAGAALFAAPGRATAQQTLYVIDNGTTIYQIAPDGTKTTFVSGQGQHRRTSHRYRGQRV